MRRRLTAGLLMALAVGGCGDEPAVSPLPIEAPLPAVPSPAVPSPAVPAPSPAVPPSSARPGATTRPATPGPARTPVRPVRTTTRTPRPPAPPPSPAPELPACRGAVVVTVDTRDELALVPALCVAVGAQLRIVNIGPGLVRVDRPELVDQRYEAGVVRLRLVRPGTVVVTVPQDEQEYAITVVIR